MLVPLLLLPLMGLLRLLLPGRMLRLSVLLGLLLTRRRASVLLLLLLRTWRGRLVAPASSSIRLLLLMLRTLLLLLLLRAALRTRRPMTPSRRRRTPPGPRRLLSRQLRIKHRPLGRLTVIMTLPRHLMVSELRLPQRRFVRVLHTTPLALTFG